MVTARGKGVPEVEDGDTGSMVMEGDLTWDGEHTVQYTDDV